MKKEQNKNLKNKKKENMAPISELVLRIAICNYILQLD